MSSAYPLPATNPGYGSQEDPPLALWFPHFRASLLCPTRSLFRVVGSSSRMDGGITSCRAPQLSWRLRVARSTKLLPTAYPPGHFANPNSTPGPKGYIGKELHFKSSCASIWLQILGGFIAALGALAIVVALTLLTPPSTVIAVSGATALVVGLGMFKIGRDKPKELSQDNTVSQSNWCPSF